MFDKGKELVGVLDTTLSKNALRYVFINVFLAEGDESVLKLETRPNTLGSDLRAKVASLLVEGKDLLHPRDDYPIARVLLPQLLEVPYKVRPAALMLAQVVVVPTVEVADQNTIELLPKRRFRHMMPSALVAQVETGCRIGKTPHISVHSILAPTGLVCMDERTIPQFILQLLIERLALARQCMQQFGDLTHCQVQPIHRLNVGLDSPLGHTARFAEVADQTHQSHTDAMTANNVIRKVRRRDVAFLAHSAVTSHHAVLGYCVRYLRYVYHLAAAMNRTAAKVASAVRAVVHHMNHHIRGDFSVSDKGICALLA